MSRVAEGSATLKVYFAPDYRSGVAYQELLARALAAEGVEVTFPYGHKRLLPLWRGMGKWRGDLLHIHWPEKFFELRHDGLDFWRKVRYPLDFALTLRDFPIVLTAHDLRPHNRAGESLLHSNFLRTYAAARAIIVHSPKSLEAVCDTYHVDPAKVHIIPHGDLSATLGPLPQRAEARAALGLPAEERICLLFGTVEPYKGIEPLLDHWRTARPPAKLVVAGRPLSKAYGTAIAARGSGLSHVRLELGWQEEDALKRWLAAADCVVFNYRNIFTSGAASLTRSLGIPMLLPHRLDTLDLMEPHPLVFRFETLEDGFEGALRSALATRADPAAAAAWREACAWSRVAARTAAVYRSVA